MTDTLTEKEITRASYQVIVKEFVHNIADLVAIHSIGKLLGLLPEKPEIIDIGCGSGRDANLKDKGYFYMSMKEGTGEALEEDIRYNSRIKKFWAYYKEQELRNILEQAQFSILEFDRVEKRHPYHSHNAFRVFCQK